MCAEGIPFATTEFPMKKLLAIGLAVMLATGCAASTDSSDDPAADMDGEAQDEIVSATEPLAMPKPVLTFLRTQDWGSHHLEWHTVRQWDRLGPATRRGRNVRAGLARTSWKERRATASSSSRCTA